jgi:flagellar biosynthesis/type III secretory pathway M-ring protein FliF/YscJ
MVSILIVALAIAVFLACWSAQHGLPVLGMKLDESDLLLISELSGEDVLEA